MNEQTGIDRQQRLLRNQALNERLWGYMDRIQRGGPDGELAFGEFYIATAALVRTAANGWSPNHCDAEDLAALTYERLWKKVDSFERTQPLPSLTGWLYRVITNLAIDRHKAAKARANLVVSGGQTDLEVYARPVDEGGFERVEIQHILAPALKACVENDYDRELLDLIFVRGMTIAQAAEHLNIHEGTAKSRYSRLLVRLRQRVGGRSRVYGISRPDVS